MAINIKVSQPKREVIRITVDEHDKPDASIKMDLKARRTLDGNVLIFDHKDIDIVLMPEKKKIVTFAKNILGDDVYEAQNRLFSYLFNKDHNATQVALFSIGKFIESEKPYIEFEKAFEKAEEERLSDPGPEESTEFDADRHDSQKGSLRPGMKPYGIASVYRI
jgi:hypothetical protein